MGGEKRGHVLFFHLPFSGAFPARFSYLSRPRTILPAALPASAFASSRYWKGAELRKRLFKPLLGRRIVPTILQDAGPVVRRVGGQRPVAGHAPQHLLGLIEPAPLVEHPAVSCEGLGHFRMLLPALVLARSSA